MESEDKISLYYTNMQKVLFIASELHKRGYEKLRVEPSISPNGMAWRCSYFVIIETAKKSIYVSNWIQIEKKYSIQELANLLEKENTEFFLKCKGKSHEYVQWFKEMLKILKEGELPYAYDDYFPPTDYWKTSLGNKIKILPGEVITFKYSNS